MKSSIKESAQGKMHRIKGRIKAFAGKMVGNRDLETEGRDENLAGKVQERIGKAKKILNK